MSAITSAFNSPFGITGELGVGTASILGANAQATPNAAAITAAGNTDTSSPFYAISESINSNNSPTLQALQEGKLTTTQHNILKTLAANNNQPTSIPWNANGTEPTIVTQIKGYGWIKIVEPAYDPSTRLVTSATYELTPVGKAIVNRTGGTGATGSGTDIVA